MCAIVDSDGGRFGHSELNSDRLTVNAGKKAAGFADLAKAIAISPKNPLGYNLRGQAYAAIEDYPRAIEQFNRAIAIKPTHDGAYANRGVAYMGQKNYQQGLADVEKALQINPNNDTAYQGRSIYYVSIKNFQGAIADANRAISINPVSPESYFIRGLAYIGLNDRAQARSSLQTAATLYQKRGNRNSEQEVMTILNLL